MAAACSSLPPAAPSACSHCSFAKPSSISLAIFASSPPAAAAGAAPAPESAAGAGVAVCSSKFWGLADAGRSASPRKGNATSAEPMRSSFFSRSMQHWCLLSMSRPSKKSMSCSFSSTVMAHARCLFPTLMGAWCTRPMIFCVPTPFATPCHRESMSRSKPRRCAHPRDMIVICAPLSTKALRGWPFTSMSTYSMITLPNASGVFSIACS
mmetsp:Transcript_11164/g.51807  ORF Transcript_11164/g.51807 Transcript_11164/m.51807 type:complete len:210 (-) Transcript_11164:604-1233(-)